MTDFPLHAKGRRGKGPKTRGAQRRHRERRHAETRETFDSFIVRRAMSGEQRARSDAIYREAERAAKASPWRRVR